MQDFEDAMLNAIERWFKPKTKLGCFFHWKQALRGNMMKSPYNFDKIFIGEVLHLFDFLTVIERSRIKDGVEFIREQVASKKGIKKAVKTTFDEYLDDYFKPTWVRSRMIPLYNYNKEEDEDWKREM